MMWRLCRLVMLTMILSLNNNNDNFSACMAFKISPSTRYNFQKSCNLPTLSSTRTSSSNKNMSDNDTADNNYDYNNNCPFSTFSKKFPRYRIDLTSFKQTKNTIDNNDSWLKNIPFMGTVQQSMSKSKLEKYNIPIKWIENCNGVHALSALWSNAAKIQGDGVIVALPNSSNQLIINWIETVNWLYDNSPPQTNRIQVSVVQDVNVPAVRISKQIDNDENDNNISPSITTTTTIDCSPSIINQRTKAWVKRILVNEGICPFTKSSTKSGQGLSDLGVPVGKILYSSSAATTDNILLLLSDTWETIVTMINAGPEGKNGISSILFAAPYYDDNFELWAGPIFAILEASVVMANASDQLGVVCFHPFYATPDGSSWPGFGHMHSVPRLEKWYKQEQTSTSTCPLSIDEIAAGGAWQRRTPHATINVLRAEQLEKAESKRSSGKLYHDNIERLVGKTNGIGSVKLGQDLQRERTMGLQ